MSNLRCAGCGQRYYGFAPHEVRCFYCGSPLEHAGWPAGGRRAAMMPQPVVEPQRLGRPEGGHHERLRHVLEAAGDQSTNRSGIGSAPPAS